MFVSLCFTTVNVVLKGAFATSSPANPGLKLISIHVALACSFWQSCILKGSCGAIKLSLQKHGRLHTVQKSCDTSFHPSSASS